MQDCAFLCTHANKLNSPLSEIFSSAAEKKGENQSLKKRKLWIWHRGASFKPIVGKKAEENHEV